MRPCTPAQTEDLVPRRAVWCVRENGWVGFGALIQEADWALIVLDGQRPREPSVGVMCALSGVPLAVGVDEAVVAKQSMDHATGRQAGGALSRFSGVIGVDCTRAVDPVVMLLSRDSRSRVCVKSRQCSTPVRF